MGGANGSFGGASEKQKKKKKRAVERLCAIWHGNEAARTKIRERQDDLMAGYNANQDWNCWNRVAARIPQIT